MNLISIRIHIRQKIDGNSNIPVRMVMGRRSLRAKIVKQLIWHKSGSRMGSSSLAGSGPKVGPEWVSGPSSSSQNRPRNPLWTHFWATSSQWRRTHFWPTFILRQINCLTILALRDLRPIIMFWPFPFLRSPTRAPTIKAVRQTVAIKAFSTIKRASVSVTGGPSPYGAIGSPYGGIRSP